MIFWPHIIDAKTGEQISVSVNLASDSDMLVTKEFPEWQTDWTSIYLASPDIEKYAVKTDQGELVALAAYEKQKQYAVVYILYMESAPASNPTMMPRNERKYVGIGELLIAYGIKLSVDYGCGGCIVFEAKTDELARHYENDFRAKRIFSLNSGGPKRYMLADDGAREIFRKFLKEDV